MLGISYLRLPSNGLKSSVFPRRNSPVVQLRSSRLLEAPYLDSSLRDANSQGICGAQYQFQKPNGREIGGCSQCLRAEVPRVSEVFFSVSWEGKKTSGNAGQLTDRAAPMGFK